MWSRPSLSPVLPHICSKSLGCWCSPDFSAPLHSFFFSFSSLSPFLHLIPPSGKGDEFEGRDYMTEIFKLTDYVVEWCEGDCAQRTQWWCEKLGNGAWAVEHVWLAGSFRCQYFKSQFTFFLIVSFHMIDSTYEKQKLQCILNRQG